MFHTLKIMLRLTQSIIQPSIRAFAVLAFAANVNAQWSAVDTFEGAKLSTMWRHTNGVALRNTGGAKGTRGFASLGKHGDMLEGRLTAAGASPVGLSDFYVELYFRVRNTTNQRFNLQIGGAELGGSARAPLNICYTAQTGWCLAAKPDGLNFPQSGLAVG
ncbi:MAG: hypothetical protein JWR69_2891, partial [Pedosphaera sp.]|nr:hypothetical protein [Pedosphaera sp.]